MKHGTLQRKWTYASGLSIFLSFFMMCVILFFSLYNWLLISEEKIAQNTLQEVVHFFESKGPIISIQDIQRNKTLLNQLVNQKQSVRILNADGIEVLRINDASPFPSFSQNLNAEFQKDKLNDQLLLHKTAEIDFGLFKGYVEISHSLESFTQLMRYILLAMLIFTFIALALSALIGYSLSSILLRPLKELRDEMQEAKRTKFSKEVRFLYATNDEIGELLTIYQQLMNEVSETITRQDEFIHNVSHELRTPIQVVEGHLSLLNRWGKEDRDVLDDSLQISLTEVQKMKLLIEEMIKLAKREQSDERIESNISKIVDDLQQKYRILSPSVSIKYEGNEIETLPIPATTLEQILGNLIDNAIKYNINQPEIIVKVACDYKHTCLSIIDNGIGIPNEMLPKIFDRFFVVDKARTKTKGGSGLGLSIVKRLVSEYKGKIYVESKENKGTKFDIIFSKMTKEE
ncbi:HAMP domain-containing histidine kinase [Psychrobacillus sp. OK032]|uniref:HAMP domain-containing sensor histidine kinase n=1 Tax=Psychrobacillus sp. OK032 TaxID=1884358 RepID=UPI0008CE44FD|nr:HAMP domain-containing histidine kinase [Psychrobacillus sp. OK032]SES09840.1 two-component system, OmpR family, sensor histidine kinase ArlS [Psychrobacillus sp. OK032]